MSEWIKTIQRILRGKARGSELMVFGVALTLPGIAIGVNYEFVYGFYLMVPSLWAVTWGMMDYREEVTYELKTKKKRGGSRIART
jgi:hypothetical protein